MGGGGMKNQCIGDELPKRWGAWTVCRFKRGVCKKDRVVYLTRVEELS